MDNNHFAKVENNIVTEVVVAEAAWIQSRQDKDQWIQTSYNTRANQHLRGGTPLRGNYAGIGFVYDRDKDVFYPPRPFPSWQLNDATYQWKAPVAYPTDGNFYTWNEQQQQWIKG